ncbi:hypothetical protein [Streptococcus suis]|uniref:hypothetical protein n=1 Tax=Streptococcus suis TaxID=1307 RepID=UPI00059B5023|nr:hypothetical protein [Streptococcus suis]NQN98317.1 hypothetical protein [Streptococcus suis]NQO02297.1 hypothetical protein [Streptococcus suis]NQO08209.1 hypothetical protein [Streptococcus suis]NQO14006.1 hypothetical protein [Streptococcus suis]NQO15931.1 hypothetical protein [Streptococcus suis]
MDLKQLAKFEKLVRSKKREIEALRVGIVNTPDYQSQRVKRSKKNTTEDQVIKRIEKIKRLETDLAQLYADYNELSARIDAITDPVISLIMRLKYVSGYSWPMIKRALPYYSQSSLYDYHKKGLEELEQTTSKKKTERVS